MRRRISREVKWVRKWGCRWDKKEKCESRRLGRGGNGNNDGPCTEGREGKGNRGDGWVVGCLDNEDEEGTWREGRWGVS